MHKQPGCCCGSCWQTPRASRTNYCVSKIAQQVDRFLCCTEKPPNAWHRRGTQVPVLYGEISKRLATPRNTKDKKHLQSTQSAQPTNLTDRQTSQVAVSYLFASAARHQDRLQPVMRKTTQLSCSFHACYAQAIATTICAHEYTHKTRSTTKCVYKNEPIITCDVSRHRSA